MFLVSNIIQDMGWIRGINLKGENDHCESHDHPPNSSPAYSTPFPCLRPSASRVGIGLPLPPLLDQIMV